MGMVDNDTNGLMSFAEFVAFMGAKHSNESKKARLQSNVSALVDYYKVVDSGGSVEEEQDGTFTMESLEAPTYELCI